MVLVKMKIWIILAALSFAGMLVTTYLTYQHFADPGGVFCNVNQYVSCDIVNQSIYAEIFGIPVAILGFLAYTAIFVMTLGVMKGWRSEPIIRFGTLFTGLGLLFSLYLTYIEFFVLEALCVFCLTQQFLIFIIFIIFFVLWQKHSKSLRSL
jgi:uncharacterized membrane protein